MAENEKNVPTDEVPEDCTHDCSSCGAACPSKQTEDENGHKLPHQMSSIKRVIGIVSGKGGVGKSLVTSLMAVNMSRRERRVAILDADVTGPSIPRAFGLDKKAQATEWGILPVRSKTGIDIMSVNLLLQNDTDPVVWRGPVISGAVEQFWTDVVWVDVDYMFIDMPPGTGDVPLTVFQSLPVDGIIVVASPQELVGMIVSKAVKMANLMNIPVLGLVENMSYMECPDCHKKLYPFGEGKTRKVAEEFGLPMLGELPIDPALAKNSDQGLIELYEGDYLTEACDLIEEKFPV